MGKRKIKKKIKLYTIDEVMEKEGNISVDEFFSKYRLVLGLDKYFEKLRQKGELEEGKYDHIGFEDDSIAEGIDIDKIDENGYVEIEVEVDDDEFDDENESDNPYYNKAHFEFYREIYKLYEKITNELYKKIEFDEGKCMIFEYGFDQVVIGLFNDAYFDLRNLTLREIARFVLDRKYEPHFGCVLKKKNVKLKMPGFERVFEKGRKKRFDKRFLSFYVDVYFEDYFANETYKNLKGRGLIRKSKENLAKSFKKFLKENDIRFHIGLGYSQPKFYLGEKYWDLVSKKHLGIVARKEVTFIDFLNFCSNRFTFITPFVFSLKEDEAHRYGYKGEYFVRRNSDYAFIPKEAEFFPLFFDFDITKKEKGEIVSIDEEKEKKVISFLKCLENMFENIFVRVSRSGINIHALIVLDLRNVKPSQRDLMVRKVFKFLKHFDFPYKLYDNIYDYARLIFNSPFPFIPVKANEPVDINRFFEKFYLAVLSYVDEEDRDYIDAEFKTLEYIISAKNLKELENSDKKVKEEKQVREKRRKEVEKIVKNTKKLKDISKETVEKALRLFGVYMRNSRLNLSFFGALCKIFSKFFDVRVYDKYFQVSISPNEKTKFDIYMYYDDPRYFYLQSENSVRHLDTLIVFVKIKDTVVPYEIYKEKYNKNPCARFVVPAIFVDKLFSNILKNFYGIDINAFILRAILRNYTYFNQIKNLVEEVKNKNEIDLKKLPGKRNRYNIGINDLIDFIKIRGREYGIEIKYESRFSFVVTYNKMGRAFLLYTFYLMLFPHDADLIVHYLTKNGIKVPKSLYYRIYLKNKISILTSIGVNAGRFLKIYGQFASGEKNLGRKVSIFLYKHLDLKNNHKKLTFWYNIPYYKLIALFLYPHTLCVVDAHLYGYQRYGLKVMKNYVPLDPVFGKIISMVSDIFRRTFASKVFEKFNHEKVYNEAIQTLYKTA